MLLLLCKCFAWTYVTCLVTILISSVVEYRFQRRFQVWDLSDWLHSQDDDNMTYEHALAAFFLAAQSVAKLLVAIAAFGLAIAAFGLAILFLIYNAVN